MWFSDQHSPESNRFSSPGSLEKNWSVIWKNDKYVFCRFLSIFHDGKIYEATEPLTEPLEFYFSKWLGTKTQNSIQIEDISIVYGNYKYNLFWKDRSYLCSTFEIVVRSPSRSPGTPEHIRTPKNHGKKISWLAA